MSGFKTKRKGDYDYEGCEFRSTWSGPMPAPIKTMLERAFHSFGSDKNVMQKMWTGDVKGTSKKEKDFFPHAPGNDICCADTVAWLLYQTGMFPLGENIKFLHKDGGFHAVNYFFPDPSYNGARVRLVKEYTTSNLGELPDDLKRKWLPGDFVIYSFSGDAKKRQGHHINAYLGPFVEIVDGAPQETFDAINGSLGLSGSSAYVLPRWIAGTIKWGCGGGGSSLQCRLIEIEKLFSQAVELPVFLGAKEEPPSVVGPPAGDGKADGKPADAKPAGDKDAAPKAGPSDLSPMDAAWNVLAKSGAPYPLGSNLVWHEGVHFTNVDGVAKPGVRCFAPGEISLVRFAKKTDPAAGDTSFLLVRHRLAPKRRMVLKPTDPKEPDEVLFHSLYVHLAPLGRYLDDAKDSYGVPLLKSDPAPPPWLVKLWPKGTAKEGPHIPAGTNVTLLALARSGTTGDFALKVIGTPHLQVQQRIALDDPKTKTPLEVDGKKYYVVPHDPDSSNAGAWGRKPSAVLVGKGQKLCYWNPWAWLDDAGKPLPPPSAVAKPGGDESDDDPPHPKPARVGELLVTSVLLKESTPLVLKDDGTFGLSVVTGPDGSEIEVDGKVLVRVRAYDRPGLEAAEASWRPADDGDDDPSTGWFEGDPGKEVKIKLRPNTERTDDERLFSGPTETVASSKHSLHFKVIGTLENTGDKQKSAKYWLDLAPCIPMAKDRRAAIEKSLSDEQMMRAIGARLDAGQSRIVGLKLEEDAWTTPEDPDHAIVAPKKTGDDDPGHTLYTRIKGSGNQRTFTEPPKKADERHDGDDTVVTLPAPDDDLHLLALDHWGERKRRRAIVEVIWAVAESDLTAQDEKDEKNAAKANQHRADLAQKLLDGQLVDLRDGKDLPTGDEGAFALRTSDRHVGCEPVGDMGAIVEGGADDSAPQGVHFQIFAGKNLLDPDGAAPPDKQIAKAGEGGWLVYKDAADKDLATAKFLGDFVKELRKAKTTPPLKVDALDDASEPDPDGGPDDELVPSPDHWRRFSADNLRQLSAIATVHPSEWRLDWASNLGKGSTKGYLSKDRLDAIAAAHKALGWWASKLLDGKDGIDDENAVWFFHPVRFIELLKTGIDVSVKLKDPKAKAKVKLQIPGRDDVDLAFDEVQGQFSYRTYVGEKQGAITGKLVLDGVATKNKEVPIKIVRGDTRLVRVVEPYVSLAMQYDQPSIDYAIPVKQSSMSDTSSGTLLADKLAHLVKSGYSRATFAVTAWFNAAMPDKVSVKLDGSGFGILTWDLDGAVSAGQTHARFKRAAAPTQLDLPLAADPGATATEDGARSVTLTLDVIAPTAGIDQASSVDVTFSGGDFESDAKVTGKVSTRTIKLADKGAMKGEDVAKLQLYLSQIFASDGMPCYRYAQTSHDCGCGDAPGSKPYVISGEYDEWTRKALWRFVYSFGAMLDWKASVSFADDATKKSGSVAPGEVLKTFLLHPNVFGPTPLDAIWNDDTSDDVVKTFARRVETPPKPKPVKKGEKQPDPAPVEWINVDGPLIDEITKRFKVGQVYPSIDFDPIKSSITVPRTSYPLAAVTVGAGWTANWQARSRMLLMKDDSVEFDFAWKEAAEGEKIGQDMKVKLSLPDKSRYTLALNGKASGRSLEVNLSELLAPAKSLALVMDTTGTDDPKANVLTVTAPNGLVIGQQTLQGVRSFWSQQRDAGRDAALLQFMLSQIPADPQHPSTSGPCIKDKAHEKPAPKPKAGDPPPAPTPTQVTVDGVWSRPWVTALGVFAKAYAPASNQKPDVVQAVADQYTKWLARGWQ